MLVVFAAMAAISLQQLAAPFENDPKQPLDVRYGAAAARATGVRVQEISFASPVKGRVPGVLVLPAAGSSGQHPVILYGHWMMPGSPMKNHREFVEEAAVMAQAGAICLLLDTPLVRPGFVEDPDAMHGQEVAAGIQMVREWRRAIDVLAARNDVDAARIAYVGHSFSAGVGAKLTAVEKRIRSFVLMANFYSVEDFVADRENPEVKEILAGWGEAKLRQYLEKFAYDDPKLYVVHSAPAEILIQNGLEDRTIPEKLVRKSAEYFGGEKTVKFYPSGHALDAAARRDRAEWLRSRLRLNPIDAAALAAIPLLH